MLRRERPQEPSDAGQGPGAHDASSDAGAPLLSREPATVLARETWTLAGDLGRRYGAVSGDRNPIHMHPLGGKAFGFPRAIAHGMWTKARSLAALTNELPDTFTVAVRFRRPIGIPGGVSFESDRSGQELRFAVRSRSREELHLLGELGPAVVHEAEQPAQAAHAASGAQR